MAVCRSIDEGYSRGYCTARQATPQRDNFNLYLGYKLPDRSLLTPELAALAMTSLEIRKVIHQLRNGFNITGHTPLRNFGEVERGHLRFRRALIGGGPFVSGRRSGGASLRRTAGEKFYDRRIYPGCSALEVSLKASGLCFYPLSRGQRARYLVKLLRDRDVPKSQIVATGSAGAIGWQHSKKNRLT